MDPLRVDRLPVDRLLQNAGIVGDRPLSPRPAAQSMAQRAAGRSGPWSGPAATESENPVDRSTFLSFLGASGQSWWTPTEYEQTASASLAPAAAPGSVWWQLW